MGRPLRDIVLALIVLAPLASAGISDPEAVVEPVPLVLLPPGVPMVDAAFGTTIVRVSDTSDDGVFATHLYSQLQAFSVDNEYLLLAEDGFYTVRRMVDLSEVDLDTLAWNAPRWDPVTPGAILHYDSNEDETVRVQRTLVDTGAVETLFTFPEPYVRINGVRSFDEVSRDGRWMSGLVIRDDGEPVVFSLDLQDGALGAELALEDLYGTLGPCDPDPTWGVIWPDWIGVSPLGLWLVVQWPGDGTERCHGLETFDIATGAFEGRVYDGHQHGDLGVDLDGVTEFFMTFELSHPTNPGGPGIGMRLLPGNDTVSAPEYLQALDWSDNGHLSCQGPDGVCLVSWGEWDGNGWRPFEQELFLQYTDGSVERLVHHRSSVCGYWVQPRASFSADGEWGIFASDWAWDGTASCDEWGAWMGVGDPFLIDLDLDLPAIGDLDLDGVNDLGEQTLGTDPLDPDTDGDGLSDGAEYFRHRSDPLDPDTDGDLFSDPTELAGGSDPGDAGSVPTPLGPLAFPLPGSEAPTDPFPPVA